MTNNGDFVMNFNSLIGGGTTAIVLSVGILLFSFILCLILIISYYKIFKKAGQPGWALFIPIYNTIVMFRIAKLPVWHIILLLLPFVNLYIMFRLNIEIAKKFGKSSGFGVGMTLLSLIFIPLLAFSDNDYEGNISNENEITNNTETNNIISEQNVESINDVNQVNSSQENNNVEVSNVFPSNTETNNIISEQNVGSVNDINSVNLSQENNNVEVSNIMPNNNLEANNIMNNQNVEGINASINLEPINSNTINDINNINIEPTTLNVQNNSNITDISSMSNESNEMLDSLNNINEPVIETAVEGGAFNGNLEVTENTIQSQSAPDAFNSVPILPVDNLGDNNMVVQENNLESNFNQANNLEFVETIPNESTNINNGNDSNVCKTCGTEMPDIVTICPVCGTDNE